MSRGEQDARTAVPTVETVLDLMGVLVGVDGGEAADMALNAVDLDDERAVSRLWDAIVAAFGFPTAEDDGFVADIPATMGELAEVFQWGLERSRAVAGDGSAH